MKIFTQLIIAGIGPGNYELVTLEALNLARSSDIILVPRSHEGKQGMAENVISHHLPEKNMIPFLFPMTLDTQQRDNLILSQLKELKPKLEGKKIFFPVVGDSMLYSTGAYLMEAMKKVIPDVEEEFIPGISAHSLAASVAKKFLVMSDEILSIIPGTSEPEKISEIIRHSDTIAIYKPSAIRDIQTLIDPSAFRKIIRVEHAGSPEKERILEGISALKDIGEYMSILLLWR